MANLTSKEKKIYRELRDRRIGKIRRYRNLVNALVATYDFFQKRDNYNAYLGGSIGEKTPDVIIKSTSKNPDIVGDGKKGLPVPPTKEEDETWDDYLESEKFSTYSEKKLKRVISDLRKYSGDYDELSKPHDYFMLCPTEKRDALKLLSEDGSLVDKDIILSFAYTTDQGKYAIRIVKEHGEFSDNEINNEFTYAGGIFHLMDDAAELLSRHKLFLAEEEDHHAPIEWIMLVIWQYILPEYAESNSKEAIIARLNNSQLVVELTLREIADFVKENYELPCYGGEISLISLGTIREAMQNLGKITQVTVSDDERSNPTYRIVWKRITKRDLLLAFVEKTFGEELQKKAKNIAQKTPDTPQPLPGQKELKEFF